MNDKQIRLIAAGALMVGALLGMAGAFAPTARLRGLAWGIDGTALVVGCALLTMHHLRRGDDLLAVAYLVYLVGETLMVAGSAMDLSASTPIVGGGTALWSAALALASASSIMPRFVKTTGAIGAALFAVTAVQIFAGASLTPMSRPLPFFGFPFLAATLVGWAWVHAAPVLRGHPRDLIDRWHPERDYMSVI